MRPPRTDDERYLRLALANADTVRLLTPPNPWVGAVVVGESRTFQGGVAWLRENGVEVIDLDSAACRTMLEGFIDAHPAVWNEDVGEE